MNLFKISILIFSFFLITQYSNAQKNIKVKVENSIEMTEELDEVWTAISNLENLDRLVPKIISETSTIGNGQGAIVTLTLKANDAKVVEEITKVDNKTRSISYRMLETPMPMSYYKATITIKPKENNAYMVHFVAVLKTDDANKEKMRTTIDNFQKTLLTNIKNKYYEK